MLTTTTKIAHLFFIVISVVGVVSSKAIPSSSGRATVVSSAFEGISSSISASEFTFGHGATHTAPASASEFTSAPSASEGIYFSEASSIPFTFVNGTTFTASEPQFTSIPISASSGPVIGDAITITEVVTLTFTIPASTGNATGSALPSGFTSVVFGNGTTATGVEPSFSDGSVVSTAFPASNTTFGNGTASIGFGYSFTATAVSDEIPTASSYN